MRVEGVSTQQLLSICSWLKRQLECYTVNVLLLYRAVSITKRFQTLHFTNVSCVPTIRESARQTSHGKCYSTD